MTDLFTFVHLTDLHIGNPDIVDDHLFSDTTANLKALLADIKTLVPQPKFIVATGDLTNQGDAGSYRNLKTILDEAGLDIPMFFALGNHDKREGFYTGMLGRTEDLAAPFFHAQVIDGVHLITLDSSTPGKVGGSIEPEQFAWLQTELDAHPDLPKLIAVHHAPALDEDRPDMEWESLTIADTRALADLLAGRNILGILSGHIHFDRVSNWHGIPVVVGIGTHAATDVTYLHEGMRMVEGASLALGTIRPSGLTISFVPQPSQRRELHSFTFAGMAEMLRKYEATQAAE
ncbi:metallophosphoesterase [Pelagibacterium halotolerans]|uniref:3',5'-cyclic-nucleotide phosphodiesterase n=1 Tax=Pelagibacterium halotolerans (strain DSM 22347 / JCM 15775 / CGMCC 1.7692 / B2) TaxID=1082931 RepID=G4RCX9_PELHB|nr:metallophosphoesterase [Pelagibacterium halotolerans]AEQ52762.1 3',5'-cyclic-nucleotide phosphodiesterase [Pelagibacterium halotolerans B2]QJR17542.1 phosphodiesterase [Pelagibacterium halotolerans]SEA76628.1 Calcineurin-like phosphoesterase [Pelagibacterium halotolerans]